mgnify:CR=1 FL=1
MKTKLLFLSTLFAVSANAQIAVTEFINNPAGNDDFREWIELYNYSPNQVNLRDWTLTDGGSTPDSMTISTSDLFIAPNDFILLTVSKDTVEYEWFGGTPNNKIYEYDRNDFTLGNSGDEIFLNNAQGNTVWTIVYDNDETNGIATFLDYGFDFSSGNNTWGSTGTAGINRSGTDPAYGVIGYQGDSATVDAYAVANPIGQVKGSPLAGVYTPTTSVNELGVSNTLTIYPNPASDRVNFSEIVSGQIMDVTGKTVATFTNQKQVSITNLKAGIFFVTIENKTYRLVKQ